MNIIIFTKRRLINLIVIIINDLTINIIWRRTNYKKINQILFKKKIKRYPANVFFFFFKNFCIFHHFILINLNFCSQRKPFPVLNFRAVILLTKPLQFREILLNLIRSAFQCCFSINGFSRKSFTKVCNLMCLNSQVNFETI